MSLVPFRSFNTKTRGGNNAKIKWANFSNVVVAICSNEAALEHVSTKNNKNATFVPLISLHLHLIRIHLPHRPLAFENLLPKL